MKNYQVLELNADFLPLNLIPVSTVSWQVAFKKIYEGTAWPLKFYEDEVIHTVNEEFPVPSVIVLSSYKKIKVRAKWSKFNVKLRDEFKCQYCMTRFSHKSLTIDHVIPKSMGGKLTWENTVAACKKCNQGKKNNHKIVPKIKPIRPTYHALAKKMLKYKEIRNTDWQVYVQHLIN